MALFSSYTDDELLVLLKDGDQGAFTEIYRRYWKLLFSVAGHKLDNLQDAEEAVQEVFADLWRRRQELVIHYSLKSFLAAAVKFQVYTMLDKSYRRSRHHVNLEESLSVTPTPETQYDWKALRDQVFLATSRLPERCRLVYQLSREGGYSNKEIAEKLDVSVKTVENQMTKALKQLRTSLRSVVSFLF
jgi:RNA polymerase sigma-70 factor (family 1)